MTTSFAQHPEYVRGFNEGFIEGGKICNEAFVDYVKNGASPTMILKYEPVWTPVTERLPELGTEVVFTVGNSMYIGSSDLYDGKRLWTENNLYKNIKNVTHWIPLPLPPTE